MIQIVRCSSDKALNHSSAFDSKAIARTWDENQSNSNPLLCNNIKFSDYNLKSRFYSTSDYETVSMARKLMNKKTWVEIEMLETMIHENAYLRTGIEWILGRERESNTRICNGGGGGGGGGGGFG